MTYIDEIYADEVLDSRGNPTIRASVLLSDGTHESAIVPSGASTGKKEALELRDDDKNRYLGKGVLKAIGHVNGIIADELVGLSPYDQSMIDNLLLRLDGTENYSNLGANATLGVSMAVARAAAKSLDMSLFRYLGGVNATVLPTPMFNVINGGSHADNNVDFQEYMIMPVGFSDFSEALRACAEIYQHLKKLLSENGFNTALGDEGGFAPDFENNEEPLEYLLKAIKNAGYEPKKDIAIALDVASSEFCTQQGYHLKSENRTLSCDELVEYYKMLCEKYPIISIEDGLSEDDWDGWAKMSEILGQSVQLVGDDLFVTNEKILQVGIDKKIANAILIKPNQIGTITQTMQTVRLATRHNYKCIVSHRSGESEDAFIADLAVALNAGEIKTGATARGERNAKYNRLLQIQNELGEFAQYLGMKSLQR